MRAKLRTLRALPTFTLAWLLPAWAAMGAAALALRILPFGRLARLFGPNIGAVGYVPIATPLQQRRAAAIRAAVAVAAAYSPLRSDCVPQALVGLLLCRLHRVPAALHIGAAFCESGTSGPRRLKAHAWLVSGRVPVTGSISDAYSPLSCFVSVRGPDLRGTCA